MRMLRAKWIGMLAFWVAAQSGILAQEVVIIGDPGERFQVPGTVWTAELQTAGDWFDSGLWTEGVPTAELPVVLVNGSETMLRVGDAVALSLNMSSPSLGRARLTQSGGRLTLSGGASIFDGIYHQSGGQFRSQSLSIAPTAQFFLLPDITEVPQPEPRCVDTDCFVVFATEKRFEIDGGDTEIAEAVTIGQGHLDIRSGQLQASSMFVDGRGWNQSAPEVSQLGGTVRLDEELKIQDGTYALAGGTLELQQLGMGDPTMDAANEFLFPTPVRSPEFVQLGGTMQISQNLELCIPGFVFPPGEEITIELPDGPIFTDVTYRLQSGNVEVLGDTVVGSMGAAPALFVQSGGTHRTAGTLRIEGVESRYELHGGTSRVGTLAVGTNVFNEGGTLSLSAEAEFIVDAALQLGSTSRYEASSGSKIQLDGGDLEIRGLDGRLFAGTQQTSLMVFGEGEFSTLEAASRDMGDTPLAYSNNFAWDDLIIGDESTISDLQLVDNFQNSTRIDAVYVDRLIISAGSSLDLNGINLYYRQAEIDGTVNFAGGKLIAVPVPEPATYVMVSVFALLAFSDHRSRQTSA